jgi:hypothetical protein
MMLLLTFANGDDTKWISKWIYRKISYALALQKYKTHTRYVFFSAGGCFDLAGWRNRNHEMLQKQILGDSEQKHVKNTGYGAIIAG